MRGLEEDRGFAGGQSFLQSLPSATGFHWQEATEAKRVAGQAGANQGGEHGGRAGQDFEGDSGGDAGVDEPIARIGNSRHAGIRHHRDCFTGLRGREQLGNPPDFVVLVK